jgi:inhibitor of cysteine peptidase
MKKIITFGLVSILLLPLLIIGCSKAAPTTPATPTTVPAINGGQEAKTIELSLDDFTAQNNIVKDIELIRPGSLIVSLGSNGSTGYAWGEAEIGNTALVTQASRDFVEPQTNLVGAPGKDVWTFDSLAAGTTTIKMSYSQPWEGGDKDTFTLTINVTVK